MCKYNHAEKAKLEIVFKHNIAVSYGFDIYLKFPSIITAYICTSIKMIIKGIYI